MSSTLSSGNPRENSSAGSATSLPIPDEIALAHSERLLDLISQRIDQDGPLDFADFMQLALYAPGLGYYMAGAQKFGVDGDFVTAPELGPLFGQALAVQLAELIANGVDARVLEIGAGSGKLAASLLPELDRRLAANSDTEYMILEPSAELRQRQQMHLQAALDAETFARLSWLESLPENFNGVIVANEVMDAMPVTRFQKSEQAAGGLQQLAISRSNVDGENLSPLNPGFAWTPMPASDAMVTEVAALEESLGEALPSGYVSEINFLVEPWLGMLHASLGHGVVLLIDYGYPQSEYYLSERMTGTLNCYYQHRAHHDPLIYPGLQDITAHVDFTRVASAAIESGFELLGYGSQSQFLLANELTELAADTASTLDSEAQRVRLNQAVKTLTLPGEMGERFQVMALGKGYSQVLRGFHQHDLSHRL